MTDTVAPAPTDPAPEPSADAHAPDGTTAQAGSEASPGQEPGAESEPRKPPSSTRLVLARHAVTAQTGPMLTGRAPGVDLSDTGRDQATALGARLADLPVTAVYASPIERTMQTAAAVAGHHGLGVEELPGVIEADYGEWTGGTIAELAKTDLWRTVQRAPSRARFPNGESMTEMQTRMVCALEEIVARHPGEMVVVVSHADPIKAAIAHFTGMHLDQFQRIVVSPASVTVFDLSPHGAALLKCNDTGSLEELKPPERKDEEDADASAAAATAAGATEASAASAGAHERANDGEAAIPVSSERAT